MCGIVGYVGNSQAVPIIMDGLRRLEYRGYDSAGVAIITPGKGLDIRRAAGKLVNLSAEVERQTPVGNVGIGHTRWATHGRPSTENAHPHTDCSGRLCVVQNLSLIHISEPTRLGMISYAVFCLKKKKQQQKKRTNKY